MTIGRGLGLAALLALIPACGGGGGGGGAGGPGPGGIPPGSLPGTTYPRLSPVDTSSPDHVIDTSLSPAAIETALQNAFTAGGIIVFNNVGAETIVLTQQLTLPDLTTVVLDGKGTVTLNGGGTTRIIEKNWKTHLTVQGLTFQNARTPDEGAAINTGIWDGSLTVIDCTFSNCKTTNPGPDIGGGAIRARGQVHLQVSGCTFVDCDGSNGGAIDSLGCRLTIIESSFTNCDAFGTGGGQDVGPTGQGGIGGAVYVDGVDQNVDILPADRKLVISGCSFLNNTANDHAGAVFGYTRPSPICSTIIDATTFSGSQVVGTNPSSGHAGALYAQHGHLTIAHSTFTGSSSKGLGGGVFTSSHQTITVFSSTFENNHADVFGGGLHLGGGTATLTNLTISGNSGGLWAGGINVGSASVTAGNTILVGNTGTDAFNGHNINQTVGDAGGNLQWPNPGGPTDVEMTAGITYADPQLLPLASNGGPTQTMGVPAGSPAENAGNDAICPAVDQRGFPRVGVCDVGAFERQ